jgi:roadblock/LC7 domain-containing protein
MLGDGFAFFLLDSILSLSGLISINRFTSDGESTSVRLPMTAETAQAERCAVASSDLKLRDSFSPFSHHQRLNAT